MNAGEFVAELIDPFFSDVPHSTEARDPVDGLALEQFQYSLS
jgi:hypothetical protein